MAEWVTLGDEIALAQRALGLSDERVAREVAVSSRTWVRYRQRGRVPVYLLDKVAEILHLEIERPVRRRITVHEDEAAVLAALADIDRRLDVELFPRLDALEASFRDLARQLAPT